MEIGGARRKIRLTHQYQVYHILSMSNGIAPALSRTMGLEIVFQISEAANWPLTQRW
jgi:hypothetical protein